MADIEVYLVLEFEPYISGEVRKTWTLVSLEKAKEFIEAEIKTYPPYSTNAFGPSKPPRFVIVKGKEYNFKTVIGGKLPKEENI